MEQAGDEKGCRKQSLEHYVSWLGELVSPSVDFDTALAASKRLETDLTELLAAEAV